MVAGSVGEMKELCQSLFLLLRIFSHFFRKLCRENERRFARLRPTELGSGSGDSAFPITIAERSKRPNIDQRRSKCHRRLIRTRLAARVTHLIRECAVAGTIDGIGIGTVVLCIHQEGVVAVNVHSR